MRNSGVKCSSGRFRGGDFPDGDEELGDECRLRIEVNGGDSTLTRKYLEASDPMEYKGITLYESIKACCKARASDSASRTRSVLLMYDGT